MSSYRDEARRALESSAAHQTQSQYLKHIQSRHPTLNGFKGVEELLALLRNPLGSANRKDAALLALVKEHQASSGGGALALLATAMFPALDHIYRTRLRRGGDADDLWGRVVGAFAEALDRYPTERRRARVAANIEGDTMGSLRRATRRELRTAEAQARLTAAAAPYLAELQAVDPREGALQRTSMGDFVVPGTEAPPPPLREELDAARAAIAPHFEASGVNSEDQFLILGVHLYQRTLGDLAAALGITRAAAKKRHLRAMARLRARPPTDDKKSGR